MREIFDLESRSDRSGSTVTNLRDCSKWCPARTGDLVDGIGEDDGADADGDVGQNGGDEYADGGMTNHSQPSPKHLLVAGE